VEIAKLQIVLLLAENCYAIRRMKHRFSNRSIKQAIGRKVAQTGETKNFPWMSLGDSEKIALGIVQERLTDEPKNRSAKSFALSKSFASEYRRVKREIGISRTNGLFWRFYRLCLNWHIRRNRCD